MCNTEFVANCIEFAAVVGKREVCKVPRHEDDSLLFCTLLRACSYKQSSGRKGR